MNIKITRFYLKDHTLGVITLDDITCFTLELPDLDNKKNVSCIPEGTYNAFVRNSPSNGQCIELKDVPNRTHIQIHIGNYLSDILGCILVGDSIRHDKTKGFWVSNSGATLKRLLDKIGNNKNITVEIVS